MRDSDRIILQDLQAEFQGASERYGPCFHGFLKIPPSPSCGMIEQYDQAMCALGKGLLTPEIVFGVMEELSERSLVAAAKNGETEWACMACAMASIMPINSLATRAYQCLPSELRVQEPIHPFDELPGFAATDYAKWMLFVYRRLIRSKASFVISRPATKLEFNRMIPSFPLDELDHRAVVTYLSINANLASAYAIRFQLNEADEPLEPLHQSKSKDIRAESVHYITLDQAAALVNRSKRTLERCKDRMPAPAIEGGGGKPAEWLWSELRPWLEREYGRPLPEIPPHAAGR
ncbi:MAG TPA: hypothetical protein VE999_01810 [Gemmataceae bacterium]|nr:hypothetical protein [Gemmataceae bacterium]